MLTSTICSTADLVAAIPCFGNKKKHGSFFYRGEPSRFPTYCLPTLFHKKEWTVRERFFHNEACHRFPEEVAALDSDLDRMVFMQHYGLPTRLLDISESPLVALYFAVADPEHRKDDGFVYAIKAAYESIHYDKNDDVKHIASLVRAASNKTLDFIESYRKILLVKPKWRNARIKAQQGLMILFGCGCGRLDPIRMRELSAEEEEIPKDEPVIHSCIRIPAAVKNRILDELEDLGINEWLLFPELPHLANMLKRKVAKRLLDQRSGADL